MSAYPVLHDTLRNNDYALIVSVGKRSTTSTEKLDRPAR